jgi:hypothetical protein
MLMMQRVGIGVSGSLPLPTKQPIALRRSADLDYARSALASLGKERRHEALNNFPSLRVRIWRSMRTERRRIGPGARTASAGERMALISSLQRHVIGAASF